MKLLKWCVVTKSGSWKLLGLKWMMKTEAVEEQLREPTIKINHTGASHDAHKDWKPCKHNFSLLHWLPPIMSKAKSVVTRDIRSNAVNRKTGGLLDVKQIRDIIMYRCVSVGTLHRNAVQHSWGRRSSLTWPEIKEGSFKAGAIDRDEGALPEQKRL